MLPSHRNLCSPRSLAIAGTALLVACAISSPAHATLTTYQSFSGNNGLSSDGCGTLASSCSLVVNVPTGSTVLSATLYTSIQRGPINVSGTLSSGAASTAVSYNYLAQNASSSFGLLAGRADVTSFVNSVVGSGRSTPITFDITESDTFHQDGEALFVIYSNPTLPTRTVALVDGSASSLGDMTSINFAQPIDKTAPGFVAEMRVADGFSYDQAGATAQESTITVNGSVLSNNVGNCDDGLKNGACGDGSLITVGGDSDPLQGPDTSPAGSATSLANTHERFDISSLIANGSSAITLNTVNASRDDNIFALGFVVSGQAGVNAPPPGMTGVPEPASLAALGTALAGLGLIRRRKSTTR